MRPCQSLWAAPVLQNSGPTAQHSHAIFSIPSDCLSSWLTPAPPRPRHAACAGGGAYDRLQPLKKGTHKVRLGSCTLPAACGADVGPAASSPF